MKEEIENRKQSSFNCRNIMIGIITVLILFSAIIIKIYIYDVSSLILDKETYDKYQKSSIFNYQVDPIKGNKKVSLSKYKGKKAYLIVNVASECGLTDKNYAELQEVYERYNHIGLEILAFPCNDFLSQEPGDNQEIYNFATKTKKATFPLFGKLDCENRNATHPLFQFLKMKAKGIFGERILWNFTKFLCDKNGIPIKRYNPTTSSIVYENDIVRLLLQDTHKETKY